MTGEVVDMVVEEEAAVPPEKKVRKPKEEAPDLTAYVAEVYRAISLDKSLMRVTKYVTPKLTVKITRRRFKRPPGTDATLILTSGKPNYAEQKFIKDCKKTGEEFPVVKPQFKFFPVKKKAKAKILKFRKKKSKAVSD